MIKVEQQDNITVIRLYRPPANAINIEFCCQLEDAIKSEIDSESKAMVLTGQGSIFSAGVDLVQLLNEGAGYTGQFLLSLEQLIETLFFCPKPVVAAINGHAIAGGCVIANCADHRLMALDSGKIGVPEIRVGVPFPVVIMELMRSKVDAGSFEEIVLGGATYTAQAALTKGLIDEAVSAEILMQTALARAQLLSEISPELYSFSKRQVRQPVRAAIIARNKLHRDDINSIWQSSRTREAIRNYMEKTFKNPGD